jgi:hypothetical protein
MPYGPFAAQPGSYRRDSRLSLEVRNTAGKTVCQAKQEKGDCQPDTPFAGTPDSRRRSFDDEYSVAVSRRGHLAAM